MESAAEKTANGGASNAPAHIDVRDLTVGYGDFVVQRNLNFKIQRGEVFVVMGGSGCGKSTVLRNLVGLAEPMAGEGFYQRDRVHQRAGGGADPRRHALRPPLHG